MIERGEIWQASLPDPRGSEPGFSRPVLVVQADALNISAVRTTMVVPLTSNLRRAEAIGHVVVDTVESGLPVLSVAQVSQVMTVDRSYLMERLSKVSPRTMSQIDAGLMIALGLESADRLN